VCDNEGIAQQPPDRPARDPQQIIDEQTRALERLREDLRRSEAERNRLRRENERLKKELDAARRAVYRQAAPFAREEVARHPKRPGRKAGAAYGPRAHRRTPTHVDETYVVPLPPQCPHCAGPLHVERTVTQYQEELPVRRPLVRRFDIAIGTCAACHRRVQSRHPLQTSDALGAAAVQLGPQAVALAVLLNKHGGLSYGKIADLFQTRFQLTVTRGGLVHAVQRAARQARPTYEALCTTVRGSPVVTVDETSWRVAAGLQWLWAFVTADPTVYAIHPGRGFAQAASVIGPDYAGVLQHDGWQPYRQFTRAAHQTCLAHLLRRCRVLRLDSPRHAFAPAVQAILQAALATRDRYHPGTLSDHGRAVARGQCLARLDRLLARRPSRLRRVRQFAAHLDRNADAIFRVLVDPTLDATNWRAEQALRPAVVTRKMSGGGNRTWRGAHSQQVLASVLRTARQRRLDPTHLLVSLLSARTPVVPDSLQSAPAVH
jgi:transposase